MLCSLLMPQPAPPSAGTITIDASRPGHPIPPNLYGIFFEEISHAGDGGLYAELIQNRGFEDSRLPPMTTLEDGFVVPERTPHFDTGSPANGGCAGRQRRNARMEAGHAGRCARVDAAGRRSIRSPRQHRMRSGDVEDLGDAIGGRVAILNEGFWGINVVKKMPNTKFSFYARSDGPFAGPIQAVARKRGRHRAGARAHDHGT